MSTGIGKFFQRITPSQEHVAGGFIILTILLLASSAYSYVRIGRLTDEVNALNNQFSSTTAALSDNLSSATSSVENIENVVGAMGGVVTTLQKLSDTDPQLLAKYSKVYFLNENYVPQSLVEIPDQYKYVATKDLQVIPQILPNLVQMLSDASSTGVAIYIDSAYRSFGTQAELKGQYIVTYGAGTANSFSAEQGYSEHQLGTALDFITTGTNGQLAGFDKKPAYAWLTANAYKYGFVLSYPPNNSYYIFEPWHWRFVGVKLATDLHNSNMYFYQMDQRTIDSYLPDLFDQ